MYSCIHLLIYSPICSVAFSNRTPQFRMQVHLLVVPDVSTCLLHWVCLWTFNALCAILQHGTVRCSTSWMRCLSCNTYQLFRKAICSQREMNRPPQPGQRHPQVIVRQALSKHYCHGNQYLRSTEGKHAHTRTHLQLTIFVWTHH